MATLAAPAIVRAQDAVDSLKILIGFPPGGTADVAARHLADKLVPGYARNVLVDNRPGAAGRIAIDTLKAAPPDGRTLLLTPASTVTIYAAVYKKLSYDPMTDLLPVSLACTFVHGFAVGPAVPAEIKNLAQYAAWAKANPAKSTCGNPGEGSFPHFLTMLLARGLDAPIQPVPYRGGAPALVDLGAGQIAASLLPDGAFLPLAKDGRARVLATSGEKRSPFFPDAGTFAEQGVKDLVVTEWFGIFAPPATPSTILTRASQAITRALEDKKLGEIYAQSGMVPQGSTPQQLAAMVKSDSATWTPRIKALGFQPIE
jgi:tripartite-type tricarboxylate transporter receptor subunit TctC